MKPLPPAALAGKRPSDAPERTAEFLSAVLPNTGAAFNSAWGQSGPAFKLLDLWTGLECADSIERGPPLRPEGPDTRPLSQFQLGRLLTTTVTAPTPGLTNIKAILLLGHFHGVSDTALLTRVATNAAKAVKEGEWVGLLPRGFPPNPSAAQVIQVFQDRCTEQLDQTTHRKREHRTWLEDIHALCVELVRKSREPRKVPRSIAPLISAEERPDFDIDLATLPARATSFLAEDLDGEGDDGDASDGDDEKIPAHHVPEAPEKRQLAEPPVEGAAETQQGGDARKARTGFRCALENQRLPWANAHLNPDDHASLVPRLRAALMESAPSLESDVAGLLAIALTTGQLVEQLLVLPLQPQGGASYLAFPTAVERYVRVPDGAWEPDPCQRERMRPRGAHVSLSLPVEVRDWLRRRVVVAQHQTLGEALQLTWQDAVPRCRSWLTEVRRMTGGYQTLSRLEHWLSCGLYNQTKDHVVPWLLCATNDRQHCPAAYYRAYETTALAERHRETLQCAGWVVPPDDAVPAPEAWVGSQVNPTQEAVKAMWSATAAHLRAIVEDPEKPLHERHNAREAHEVLSMLLLTLHRVVSDPFESLEFIDLEKARLLIADKQQGDARSHRVVPLAELSVRHCMEHKEHLRRLALALAQQAPETASRIAAALEQPALRLAPFRFLLSPDGKILRLTPARLLAAVVGVWTLPLNLARHFVSTWMLERGASDDVLCSLLGHQDLGTLSLSTLSPFEFESLFASARTHLNELTEELELSAMATFLPPQPEGVRLPAVQAGLTPMPFGYLKRDSVRALLLRRHSRLIDQWLREQFVDRKTSSMTQVDVDALFEKVRKASPNRRSFVACRRFELMRDAIVAILREDDSIKVELPAVALSIRDVEHICPLDGLEARAWITALRSGLERHWHGEFSRWKKARTASYVADPIDIILTLVLDSLVLDPDVWDTWSGDEERTPLTPALHPDGQAWLRCELPADNSRLYPVDRALAELCCRVPAEAWSAVDLDAVARLANQLVAPGRCEPVHSFGQLLSRVQSGMALDVPGVVLGYADGSHGSVSVPNIAIERAWGNKVGPTQKTLDDLQRRIKSNEEESKEEVVLETGEQLDSDVHAANDVQAFRHLMSRAFKLLARGGSLPSDDKESDSAVAQRTQSEGGPKKRKNERDPNSGGGMKRMDAFLTAHQAQINAAPVHCILVARWIGHLARTKQSSGRPYKPKTLKNYWYSWGLRLVEELEGIDPRRIGPEEFEEIYLQIVEDADVVGREHLYAPMRSFHNFLVVSYAAPAIAWNELRWATGQDSQHVNANFVFKDEYKRALALLTGDPYSDAERRAMQAAAMVFLYRGGLRITECLGLRDGDVVKPEGTDHWRIRIAGNLYRRLKTDSARRVVVLLENLDDDEQRAIEDWTRHIKRFGSEAGRQPIFRKANNLKDRNALYPSRLLALRLGQALRIATSDPTIRVHHCRHSMATRLLLLGLGGGDKQLDYVGGAQEKDGVAARVRNVLCNQDSVTRRVLWGVAGLLGHSSPMTTLGVYFHGGGELLRQWQQRRMGAMGAWTDDLEGLAFLCGRQLKTLQTSLRRLREDESDRPGADPVGQLSPKADSLASTQDAQRPMVSTKNSPHTDLITELTARWTGVPIIGAGQRLPLASSLPEVRLSEAENWVLSVDRIIDHARRFNDVAGLSREVFVSEEWISSVLDEASSYARRAMRDLPEDQWWVTPKDEIYSRGEILQVDEGISAIQSMSADQTALLACLVDACFVPSRRMFVVESPDRLREVGEVLAAMVKNPSNIEILVPALKEERSLDSAPTQVNRPNAGIPIGQKSVSKKRPRRTLSTAVDSEVINEMRRTAATLGLTEVLHDRVPEGILRPGRYRDPSSRVGVRVRENADDQIRSAKVMERVLLAAAISARVREGSSP